MGRKPFALTWFGPMLMFSKLWLIWSGFQAHLTLYHLPECPVSLYPGLIYWKFCDGDTASRGQFLGPISRLLWNFPSRSNPFSFIPCEIQDSGSLKGSCPQHVLFAICALFSWRSLAVSIGTLRRSALVPHPWWCPGLLQATCSLSPTWNARNVHLPLSETQIKMQILPCPSPTFSWEWTWGGSGHTDWSPHTLFLFQIPPSSFTAQAGFHVCGAGMKDAYTSPDFSFQSCLVVYHLCVNTVWNLEAFLASPLRELGLGEWLSHVPGCHWMGTGRTKNELVSQLIFLTTECCLTWLLKKILPSIHASSNSSL